MTISSAFRFAPVAAVIASLALAGCSTSRPDASAAQSTAVLYDGARLIPGDGSPAVERGAMLVEDGRITRIGAQGEVSAPTRGDPYRSLGQDDHARADRCARPRRLSERPHVPPRELHAREHPERPQSCRLVRTGHDNDARHRYAAVRLPAA